MDYRTCTVLDWSVSGQEQVTGSCGSGYEPSGS